MEKFALLNLLKAINGIKSVQTAEKEQKSDPPASSAQSPVASAKPLTQEQPHAPQYDVELPNIMYETLMRHETVSNRLRNKK